MKLSELVQKGNLSAKSLDKKEISTGSIVLDTVREYTKKYPLCVLLVQVGDFYEVSFYIKKKKGREREREQCVLLSLNVK